MKKINEFESKILDFGESFKPSLESIINNIGKIVAVICIAVTLLVTFTDVSFASLDIQNTLPTLLLLLVSSYIIYFSLEDAGEKLGQKTAEYIAAKERFDKARQRIGGERIGELRDFLEEYSKSELEYRRRRLLFSFGLCEEDLIAYINGKNFPRKKQRILCKISKKKPISLTPEKLLGSIRPSESQGFELPLRKKLFSLITKLLPSTLCMCVTVSVILRVKSDMSASDVLTALLKLSALPIVGFKGYSAGYQYAKCNLTAWLNARSEIIESFLFPSSAAGGSGK